MRIDGFKNYIADNTNKLDLGMLLVFVTYFVMRMAYRVEDSNFIIPSVREINVKGGNGIDKMTYMWFALVILNTVIIV